MKIELEPGQIWLLLSALEQKIEHLSHSYQHWKDLKCAVELQEDYHAIFIALLAQSGLSTQQQLRYDKQFREKLAKWRKKAGIKGNPIDLI